MLVREDKLTELIICCAVKVHRTLGPGFLEKVYGRAMQIELKKQNLVVEIEKEIPIRYEGIKVGCHRLDILVENTVILEVKAVESLGKVHYAQVRSYLKAAALGRALLINFAGERADFRRVCIP